MKKVLRITLAALGLLALFSALQLCFAAWGRPYETGGRIQVVDHVVYYRSGKSYVVVDYFDTDAAAANATAVNIRADVNGKPVTRISLKSGIKAGNRRVTRITLPGSLKSICANAFYNFEKVESLTLPAALKSIGVSAFQGMRALKTITLPKKIHAVPERAFYGCAALQRVNSSGKVTEYGKSAFQGCAALSWVGGYSNAAFVDDSAFAGTGFPTVRVLHTAVYGSAVFANCKKLTTAVIESGARPADLTIAYGMFSGCSALRTLRFPNQVGELTFAFHAFQNCTALQTLVLPKQSQHIYFNESSFLGCKSLQSIRNVNGTVTIGSSAFSGCTALQSMTIPTTTEYVAPWAFYNCPGLRTLRIEGTDRGLVQNGFLNYLPAGCTVYVKTRAMKRAAQDAGYSGKIVVG
ncbi:MAG: leucine-rich repeat domain-containing protein [Clostridia bacterium]|nr:leucine-rich repeat domain-containing protein [Clostridia bacterium]MBR3095183.1 leucine-rich repeat domain-containing protein [Clostridia bacterium]